MTNLVGHFLVFTLVAIGGLIVPLLVGKLLRPKLPTAQKDSIYECGEPTIGSSYVQFDLRFYVVALLFIVFDVEVAFFFPWAMIYGTSTQLASTALDDVSRQALSELLTGAEGISVSAETAKQIAVVGLFDILVFFSVLLVGFAYVWKRGDLDWVRAVAEKARQAAPRPQTPPALEPPATPKPDPEPVSV